MFERLSVMLMKEFLELRRDRWAMFRLIVPMILQMFVFGYAATFTVHHVTTALFDLVVLGIGYLISVRIRNQLGASQVALLLTMLPTTLLSGYTFPIDQMPTAIQVLTYAVYSRYYVTILRTIFLKGGGLTDLWTPVLGLVAYAAIIIWLAARAFRKHL